MTSPQLTYLARIEVRVAPPVDLGVVAGIHRRIVPIIGGTISGPALNGTVLAAGADFQVLHEDATQELEARYGVELEDGERLYIENHAIRTGHASDMARLARGETVDPALIYFRSSPRITAPRGAFEWLNSRVFVATGERRPDLVCLEIFVVE